MMTIDWTNFTPWTSLIGGMLIGAAAALFIFFNGRIAGISGILGALLKPAQGDMLWRVAFLGGMVAAPLVYGLAAQLPEVTVDADVGTLVAADLLAGLGTRYGSGCTSGHGVCGIARLSPRSFIATVVFMAAGFATVYAMRHLLG